MTQFEIVEEVKKLKPSERLAVVEAILHLTREDIQEVEEKADETATKQAVKPFTFKVLELPGYPPDFTFRREDIYGDDGR